MTGPVKNTDRELFREHTDLTSEVGGYYENSVHVTIDGKIGMNVGGTVIVQPIADWHEQARRATEPPTCIAAPRVRPPLRHRIRLALEALR